VPFGKHAVFQSSAGHSDGSLYEISFQFRLDTGYLATAPGTEFLVVKRPLLREEPILNCMVILENEEILRCTHKDGNFRLPFGHLVEEKWYNFMLSFDNEDPGMSYAAIISDHLMLSQEGLKLLKTG